MNLFIIITFPVLPFISLNFSEAFLCYASYLIHYVLFVIDLYSEHFGCCYELLHSYYRSWLVSIVLSIRVYDDISSFCLVRNS